MASQDSSQVKLTYEDYCRIPDDGRRHEILDGEHHVSPAPRLRHQSILVELVLQLRQQMGQPDLVYVAPADLQLSEVDILQPDLMVIAPERCHILSPAKVEGPPDLVVEVLSPSTEALDRGRKMQRYAAGGVPEYWIVNPAERLVERYVLEGGEFRLDGKHQDELTPRALAHVRLEIRKLW